jgi:hypothetical protein
MNIKTEISIADVTAFFIANWRLYFASVSLFVLFALGFNLLFPRYTAEINLKYNAHERSSAAFPGVASLYDSHFDLVSWRATQEQITLLARDLYANSEQAPQWLAKVGSPSWWSSHFLPVKALSTDEAKEILGINAMIVGNNKPTEDSNALFYLSRAIREATRVSGFVLTSHDSTSENAKRSVVKLADFIQGAAASLRLKKYVEVLAQEQIDTENQVTTEVFRLNEEIATLKKRQHELMELGRVFPQQFNITLEGAFSSENAKYLPVQSQIIANRIEISAKEDRLIQLDGIKRQILVRQRFVSAANNVFSQHRDFTNAYEELLGLLQKLKINISPDDAASLQAMHLLHYQLTTVYSIADRQFSIGLPYIAKQTDYYRTSIRAAFLGFVIGLLLSVSLLFFRLLSDRRK